MGYFSAPGHSRPEHSLGPQRLYGAVEQAALDLGREPDLVFLHNPEHSLGEGVAQDREALAQACAALDEATTKGLCRAWGVASWSPSPLQNLIGMTTPRPSVFMVRAGLLVGTRTLDAAEAVSAAWGLDRSALWGMSPFGGSANAPVWDRIDPRVFVQDAADLSPAQATFRTAYALPEVAAVAVGTDNPDHLGDLIDALACEADERAVREYRHLLRKRVRGQPA